MFKKYNKNFFMKTFIGLNGNITSRVSFNNTEFAQRVKGLQPDIIRIPGGLSSWDYDWKTEKNVTLESVAKLQTKILFVLNITHTLEDQLQMLDKAKSLGIDFYCEIGSEINNPGSTYKKMFKNGVEFGKKCKAWSDAIHAKFPETQVGVWGESQDEFPTWTDDVLSVYTPDALCFHTYPDVVNVSADGVIDDDRLYKHLDDKLKRTNLYNSSIKLWATEYNLLPTFKNLKRYQHRKAIVRMTHYFTNHNVEVMCIHNIYGLINGAYFYDENNVLTLGATGIALKKLKNIN